jgi:hypothetical protein
VWVEIRVSWWVVEIRVSWWGGRVPCVLATGGWSSKNMKIYSVDVVLNNV